MNLKISLRSSKIADMPVMKLLATLADFRSMQNTGLIRQLITMIRFKNLRPLYQALRRRETNYGYLPRAAKWHLTHPTRRSVVGRAEIVD